MAKNETIEIIGIIEECPVMGVKYGPIKVPQTVVDMGKFHTAKNRFSVINKIRAKKIKTNTKHK